MTYSDDSTADDAEHDYSDEMATFGDRIAAAREAMGMTPSQLARRLGVKLQTLQGWEHDRAEPRANKLQMLAGVLNISIRWLLTGEGDGLRQASRQPESGEIDALVAELRQIRTRQTELAEHTLRLELRLLAIVRPPA